MKRMPLRAFLLIPLLASLALGSLALGGFVYRAVQWDLLATIDAELTRVAASRNQRGSGHHSDHSDGAGRDDQPVVIVLGPDDELLGSSDQRSEALLLAVRGLRPSRDPVTVGEDPRYRVLITPESDGAVSLAALSLAQSDESLASLRRNLLWGGLVLVVVQGLVVIAVARSVARPVAQLSRAAHQVSGGDLDADLGPPSGPRETAALNQDLRAMINTLGETIERSDRAADQARRSRDDMERFMADAAHELRTPLTALRGYSELFADGMLDEAGLARAMERIGGESTRMTALVNDLLDLARPADESRWEPVDLEAVTSAIAHDLRAAHPDHRIETVGLNPGSTGGATVIGNPMRLHQAVLNLAANACQHTPAGTAVALTVEAKGQRTSVSVIDHGPGIPIDVAGRLFAPFTRGDESRSRRTHDGAGLGLALVKRIVDQHGGTVGFEPTPAGGATFRLELASAPPGPPSPDDMAPQEAER